MIQNALILAYVDKLKYFLKKDPKNRSAIKIIIEE